MSSEAASTGTFFMSASLQAGSSAATHGTTTVRCTGFTGVVMLLAVPAFMGASASPAR